MFMFYYNVSAMSYCHAASSCVEIAKKKQVETKNQ